MLLSQVPSLHPQNSARSVSPHCVNALRFFSEGICVATGGGAKVDGHHHHVVVSRRLIVLRVILQKKKSDKQRHGEKEEVMLSSIGQALHFCR